MACKEPTTVIDDLSSTLIPAPLQSMCSASLKLIANASSVQVSTAVEYNQHSINVLLIQLLTINFISQNRKQIENDINNLKHNHKRDVAQLSQGTTTHDQSNCSSSQTSSDVNPDLEEYCERKLLCLSPILGFSRKNYFVEYNMSTFF